ncbi:MAG: hypothetical protein MI748_01500 [Opitutales bacterium]|nr:hypothetical protein [Opitutales bacterium]
MNRCSTLLAAVFVTLMSSPFLHSGDEQTDKIWKAFEKLENTSLDDWGWSFEETGKEGVRKGVFLPIIEGRGKVILRTVNGKKPEKNDLKKFHKKFRDRKAKAPGEEKSSPSKMITPDTLELVGKTENTSVYHFVPRLNFDEDTSEDEQKFFEGLNGVLVYDDAGEFVKSLELKADKPFKPDSKVKIKEMVVRFVFERLPDQTIVVSETYNKVVAKALLLMRVNQESTMRFFDYRKVEKP